MSDAWTSGNPSGGSVVEFEVDSRSGFVSSESFLMLVDFLYGVPPDHLTNELVKPLLAIGSYFGVPQLCEMVSDYAFANMDRHSCALFVDLDTATDYGQAGKNIADAAIAYLQRNALDIGEKLCELELKLQVELLTSDLLYIQSEFHRYQLALRVKRAGAAMIASACPQICLHCSAKVNTARLSLEDGCTTSIVSSDVVTPDVVPLSWGGLSWSGSGQDSSEAGPHGRRESGISTEKTRGLGLRATCLHQPATSTSCSDGKSVVSRIAEVGGCSATSACCEPHTKVLARTTAKRAVSAEQTLTQPLLDQNADMATVSCRAPSSVNSYPTLFCCVDARKLLLLLSHDRTLHVR